MITKIVKFFDVLENKIRAGLSHNPIMYALIGGVGVILFWRGVWHTADLFPFMTGPVSTIIGSIILLLTGVFVSAFVGNKLILSGLKGDKKLAEKTEEEIASEESELKHIEKILEQVEKDVEEIKEKK